MWVGGPTNNLIYPNSSWSWVRLRLWLGCDNWGQAWIDGGGGSTTYRNGKQGSPAAQAKINFCAGYFIQIWVTKVLMWQTIWQRVAHPKPNKSEFNNSHNSCLIILQDYYSANNVWPNSDLISDSAVKFAELGTFWQETWHQEQLHSIRAASSRNGLSKTIHLKVM